MSNKKKFEKAASIIKSLPKVGPVKPSVEDQLYVSMMLVLWFNFRDIVWL